MIIGGKMIAGSLKGFAAWRGRRRADCERCRARKLSVPSKRLITRMTRRALKRETEEAFIREVSPPQHELAHRHATTSRRYASSIDFT